MSEIALSLRHANFSLLDWTREELRENRRVNQRIIWRRNSRVVVGHARRGGVSMCTHGENLILLSAYNTQLYPPRWTETQHLPWRIRPIFPTQTRPPPLTACFSLEGWRRGEFMDTLGLGVQNDGVFIIGRRDLHYVYLR